jgi:hypothetical protein
VARTEQQDQIITITVDGTEYRLNLADLGAPDTVAVRQATGHPLRWWQAQFADGGSDADIDAIAVYVWLSRRRSGEPRLAFVDVLETLDYASKLEVDFGGSTDPEDDSPEA